MNAVNEQGHKEIGGDLSDHKKETRAEQARQLAEFLLAGGQIQQIPQGRRGRRPKAKKTAVVEAA